jgi:Chaperone of endosialidase
MEMRSLKFNFYNTKTRRNTMSDIRLDDNNNVILEGNVGIGINNPARPLHVEGGLEVHSGGSGGGYSFSDRNKPGFTNNPANGERWVWYAADGIARLWSGNDKLSVAQNGNVSIFGNVGIGINNPARPLHVEGGLEVHSGGSGGGYSFSDRNKPGFTNNPANGERWVWYAADGIARLWSGNDKLSVAQNGNVSIFGNVGIGTNNPTNKLHIVGDGPVTIENPNGESDILFKSGSSQTWQVGTNSFGWYVWDNAYRLVVKPGGSVGIGTNNPTNKLHIVGDGPVTIENPNGESDILFKSGSSQTWQVGTNSFGWYVWDNAYRLVVKPGGSVGIGTNNPLRRLHVEGGEIHSGGSGAGFSFSNRSNPDFVENPSGGDRWLWYAVNGQARLWSGKDALEIVPIGSTFSVRINGSLDTAVKELRGFTDSPEPPTIRCRAAAIAIEDPSAPLSVPGTATELLNTPKPSKAAPTNSQVEEPPPPPLPEPTTPVPPRIALFHNFSNNQKDGLVINYQGRYKDGVRIEGNVQTTGALTQASSIALKENVTELSGQEAMSALQGLNAVKYNYKADNEKEQHIGFIAEEVPDLVANSERDRLSPMDIIAVLTKAMQEQQRMIADLTAKVSNLGQN